MFRFSKYMLIFFIIISWLGGVAALHLNNNSDWLAYISLTVWFGSLLYAMLENFKTSKQLEELQRQITQGFQRIKEQKSCLCWKSKSQKNKKNIIKAISENIHKQSIPSQKKNDIDNQKNDSHDDNI